MKTTVVGIDVSKDDLHYCVKVRRENGTWKVLHSGKCSNTGNGFTKMLSKVPVTSNAHTCFVMEATGVYHERLADYLYNAGLTVYVELPNRVKNFARYLNVKTKTDKIDSGIIAEYGIRTDMTPWHPASKNLSEMRDISREILICSDILVRLKNQYHALKTSAHTDEGVLKAHGGLIRTVEQSRDKLRKRLHEAAEKDKDFSSRVANVSTIPGVGEQTAIQLACETNGFLDFHSISQLVSYAGFDIVEYQSGTIEKRTRISKRGNPRIRKLMYMSGLSATRSNTNVARLYERIVKKNPNIKMKGIIAAARKQLVLVYTLWKNNCEYDPRYYDERGELAPASLDSTAKTDRTSFD